MRFCSPDRSPRPTRPGPRPMLKPIPTRVLRPDRRPPSLRSLPHGSALGGALPRPPVRGPARSGAASLAGRYVRSGTAAALAELARAAVAEEAGDRGRAERLCLDAVDHAEESPARALALLHLARLRTSAPAAARGALEEARVELSRCSGAVLLETLAAETQSELGSRDRVQPATGELSPAEQRVLRLLMTRLTQREIANELYVSLNTVKTHARVIYRKLGVGSRAGAVAAARELNLV